MEVEWLILADAAQVVGGKLNLLGGGWDVLTVNDAFPHRQHLAVAVSFKVLWNETNQRHNVHIAIVADDSGRELMKVDGQMEVGRPAGILQGQDQRAQIAAESIVDLEEGTYVIIAGADNGEEKRFTFRVVAAPGLEQRSG